MEMTYDFNEIIKTEKFRLIKYKYLDLHPYSLEVFNPAYGYESALDLSYSDLAELIELFNKYTEEK